MIFKLFTLCSYIVLPLTTIFIARAEMLDFYPDYIVATSIKEIAFGVFLFYLFMTQIVLGSRVKYLERGVGLNVVMKIHGMTTIFTLSLLIVHFFIKKDGEGIAKIGGLVAGITMLVLVCITVFLWLDTPFARLPIIRTIRKRCRAKIQYQHFRAMHNIMAIVAIIVGLHIGLGDFAEDSPMALLIMRIYFLLAFLHYVFHKCIKPEILKKSAWKISEIVQESEGADTQVPCITTLKMNPVGKKPFRYANFYKGGQFGFFRFMTGALNIRGEEHPFSFSSSTADKYISITVQDDGDFTHRLQTECKVGDTLYIDGAYGTFYPQENKETDIVAIAGGIGITPYMGWLENIKNNTKNNRKMTLIWLRREKNDVLTKRILSYNDCPNIQVKMFSSKNPLSDECLSEILGKSKNKNSCYICASKLILQMINRQLLKLGVARKNIHTESFNMG